MLKSIIQDLLEKSVIKEYSQYASAALLVPKPQGRCSMVADYRLLNKNVLFDIFPPHANC
jgi:hypothetical protein